MAAEATPGLCGLAGKVRELDGGYTPMVAERTVSLEATSEADPA